MTTAKTQVRTKASRKGKRFDHPHPADDLSFMEPSIRRGKGIEYWLVSPTGNYTEDCEIGSRLADEYLTYIGQHPTNFNATLLTSIVREMIDRAKDGAEWSGVHVGFLAGVNRMAMALARMIAVTPKERAQKSTTAS